MTLTQREKETRIRFDESDDAATVTTHSRKLRNRLSEYAKEAPGDCKYLSSGYGGQAETYSVPKSWVRILPPRKSRMSAETKERLAENMRKFWKAKKAQEK